jgi:F-type H+-transporting ATPase subunit a
MEPHISWLTVFVNKIFGGAALSLLHLLHIKPNNPATPIPEHVVMALVVLLVVVIGSLILKSRLSVERPGAFQQCCEFLLTNPLKFGVQDCLDENIPHHAGRKFIPMVGAVALFILVSNLLSVFPVFSSPTVEKTVPLACALVTFFYFNYQGVRAHGGGGYLKHFAGPNPYLAPLLFPVEIISTTARVLSLTVRLWANMFSSELIYVIFLGLLMRPALGVGTKIPAVGVAIGIFPAIIPVAFIGLHIFVAIIQTYVFTILPSIYLGMAVAKEH